MNLKQYIRRFRAWQRAPRRYKSQQLSEHRCANCGNEFTGNFCPVCGQNGDDSRISWQSVWQSFMNIWNIDSHSLPVTLWQLLLRPGYLIGEYISGHKQVCFPPVNMLFAVAVIYILINQMLGIENMYAVYSSSDDLFKNVAYWLSNNPGWGMMSVTMMMIPPTWFFFHFAPRHSRHTLPEGIFIQLFLSTLLLICSLLTQISGWFYLLIPFYYQITYQQLFGYNFWSTFWRLLLSFFVWLNLLLLISSFLLIPSNDHNESLKTILNVILFLLIAALAILAFGYWISRRTSLKTSKGKQESFNTKNIQQ